MHRFLLTRTFAAAALIATPAVCAAADEFHAVFSGFNEVGALNNESGAILSDGKATLTLKLDRNVKSLTYSLTYSNLGSTVTQAHIHFAKIHVPGGILAFLCSNLGNGPAGTPACPPSGTVTGTITPASVRAIAGQNVAAGDFDALTDALASDTSYGNIHTTKFPNGEIRGEIRRGGADD